MHQDTWWCVEGPKAGVLHHGYTDSKKKQKQKASVALCFFLQNLSRVIPPYLTLTTDPLHAIVAIL